MAPGDEKLIVTMTAGDLRKLVRDEVERLTASRPAKPPGKWADIATAAEHCGCTPQTIRAWIRAGAPARILGSSVRPSYRIDLAELDEWARKRSSKE